MLALVSLCIAGALAAGPVTVRFTGVDARAVLEELRQTATFVMPEDVPASDFLIGRRADDYLPRLQSVLQSHGYYDADVSVTIGRGNRDNLVVTYDIATGPVYTVGQINLQVTAVDADSVPRAPGRGELALREGDAATATPIRKSADELLRALRRQGFAFATVDRPEVQVDHRNRSVTVFCRANAGPPTRFGTTQITGLRTVDETFVRNKIPWREGQRFNPDAIQRLRARLMDSELFSVVRVQYDTDEPRADLPMHIELAEAHSRLVSAGIGYDTDRGLGVRAAWEHRNLRGHGERLRVNVNTSETLQEGGIVFRKPHFLHPDRSLVLRGTFKYEETDAYDSTSVTLGAHIERRLTDHLTVDAGVAATGTRVKEAGDADDFYLASLPLRLDWDRRNAVLDPTRGWRLTLAYTPFAEVLSGDPMFHNTSVGARYYWKILPTLVAAFRGRVGTIWGESVQDVPADQRYYGGGGGSIRGYPYQGIGPRTDGDQPAGGLALLEVAAELRGRWRGNWGWALFVDGGNVYRKGVTDIDGALFWGAGAGMRYYTPVGPLRLDLAFPLNRPGHVKDNFQIYISLGQSF